MKDQSKFTLLDLLDEKSQSIYHEGYLIGWNDKGEKCPYPKDSQEEHCWLCGRSDGFRDYENI